MDEKPTQEPDFSPAPLFVIITGLSGAGKSTAMRFLEDLGCYCVDNLPPSLVPTFFSLYRQSGTAGTGVAIASDVRSGALFGDFSEMVKSLRDLGVKFDILYLDCDTDKLILRFKQVRRNHPLQQGRSMEEAIEEERRRLEPIRTVATLMIDTSDLEDSGLRETLIRNLMGEDSADLIRIEFVSFGFKYGIPRDADFVFDMRFLPNPFYLTDLRPMSGENEAVYNYVMSQPLSFEYFNRIVDLVEGTLEPFVKVGKTNLVVGLGCTGGRHRSVAFAKRLAEHFQGEGRRSWATHRDIAKPQS